MDSSCGCALAGQSSDGARSARARTLACVLASSARAARRWSRMKAVRSLVSASSEVAAARARSEAWGETLSALARCATHTHAPARLGVRPARPHPRRLAAETALPRPHPHSPRTLLAQALRLRQADSEDTHARIAARAARTRGFRHWWLEGLVMFGQRGAHCIVDQPAATLFTACALSQEESTWLR